MSVTMVKTTEQHRGTDRITRADQRPAQLGAARTRAAHNPVRPLPGAVDALYFNWLSSTVYWDGGRLRRADG